MGSDFVISEQVHRGVRSRISRATERSTGEEVVLKESTAEVPLSVAAARLTREFAIAKAIRSQHVVRYLGLRHERDRVALVEEAFGDASLATIVADGPLEVAKALHLARQVALGLGEIHRQDVVHRAIHPGNIVVNTANWTAKIVDFAGAFRLHHEAADLAQELDDRAMPLAYLSPEHTGRIHRKVDHRSDFYSLGAVLYHALAGRPPFELSDALAHVHAHIALTPRPLTEVDDRIPEHVSTLVEKLLAKSAELRYQSARGIVADIDECLWRLRTGNPRAFPLGEADLPEKFAIPDKLYGRSSERNELISAFDAAAEGKKLLLLVSGDPGTGKSTLIQELREPALKRGGTFVSGKFDQLHRNAPYSALSQALTQLCRSLLSLPEEELAQRAARILERVAANAGLIIDLVPELEQIIGPQPKVPQTNLVQAQDRFELTLARFLAAFSSAEQPLVLVLDDLQWADPATLHALSAVLRLPEPKSLLVIGAYRTAEVGPTHPLALTFDELGKSAVELRSLKLSGLKQADVRLLVADTVQRDDAETEALADLVAERTACNPFYVDQFLRALHDDELLQFSKEQSAWAWDLREVASLGITASLAELMARKLERLPAPTKAALQLAACIGNQFELQLLAAAADVAKEEMRARLGPAIRERLVVALDAHYPLGLVDLTSTSAGPADYQYRFLHDRIQHAAYARASDSARAELHLRVGRALLAQAGPNPRGELVFDIVDQLNHGTKLTSEPPEQLELARLNLRAGQCARAGTAYQQGLLYFRTGIEALRAAANGQDPWRAQYDLWFSLHRGYLECAYLAGQFEHAGTFLDELMPRVRSATEQAGLQAIRIGFETNRGHYGRAIQLGRAALATLGHPIPELDSKRPLLAVKVKTELALRTRSVERFARQADAKKPREIAVAQLLSQLSAPAYLADRKLFFWLAHEGMRVATHDGLTSVTATACTGYSGYLIAREHDYARAQAYGQLGLELARRPDAFAFRGHVHVLFAICANALAHNHIRTSLSILQRGIEMGLESGDYFFASLGCSWIPEIRFLMGESLDEVGLEAERREREIRSLRGDERALQTRIFRQVLRCLRGETRGRLSLSSDDVSEEELHGEVEALGSTLPSRGQYFLCKVRVFAWFGAYREVVQTLLVSGAAIEEANAANVRMPEYTFLVCLALIEARSDPRFDRHQMQDLLKPKLELLARWADSAPVNFLHQWLLVQAELAESEGRTARATEQYNEAIRLASTNGYLQHVALASELAGRAFARRGNQTLARSYLRSAREGYLRWGALGKVQALDQDHPDIAPAATPMERAIGSLDAVSAVRASQALTSEISLPALMERMLRVIVQASGAQRGALLVTRSGQPRVAAHLDLQTGELKLATEDAPLNDDHLVSQAIVRYTLRTNGDVALVNARQEGPFTSDPYVVFHHSKSVLCMAVRHRDHVSGVLFLENQLADGVFTGQRLELLRLLLAQAAISLENAQLFDATQKLNAALRSSESLLRDLFEGMPVGVYVVDAQGRHAFSNRRAGELIRNAPDGSLEVTGVLSAYDLYIAGTDQPYPTNRTPLARALSGERSMVDDMEVRLPGRTVPLAVWGTPILGEDGAVRYALAAFQDITPQREAERVRAQLENQLHQAERLESIGRLAGGVAHDFNNLLTPMLIYADLAAQALAADSPVRRHVSQIVDAAEQAAELTKQLLAFGRQQVLEPRALDLNQELQKFEKMLRRVLRENIALHLRLEPVLGQVCVDPAQIQRVFMNLAMNAADAMPRGGSLTFETRNVLQGKTEQACSREGPVGPCVLLRVSDTGHGMDKEAMSRVFSPFFTTKEVGKGTGLGLPTVHGIVAQHGGRIEVHSEPGTGTTFELLFPRVGASVEGEMELADVPNLETACQASDRVDQRSGRGETLLVVEDNDSVRSVVREVLIREGYLVLTTSSAAEALRLVQRGSDAPRLVITDVVMPVMSGYELVAELRRQHVRLPVLMISGYSDTPTLSFEGDRTIELLQKPLNIDALRAAIRRLLDTASPGDNRS